eukprot:scaffold1268_cov333-Pinguiococcus_pyrenoidosus.AAC.1
MRVQNGRKLLPSGFVSRIWHRIGQEDRFLPAQQPFVLLFVLKARVPVLHLAVHLVSLRSGDAGNAHVAEIRAMPGMPRTRAVFVASAGFNAYEQPPPDILSQKDLLGEFEFLAQVLPGWTEQ